MYSDLTSSERAELRRALARAIASGHQSVTFSSGGTSRTINYQSVADMKATLRELQDDASNSSFANRAQTASTTRGTEG